MHQQNQTNNLRSRPSQAALALATRTDEATFHDVYRFAWKIDEAFEAALEETREEERTRIFRMSFAELMREFWKGRKLYRAK